MHQPSSRNLTEDFPAYKGLSLRELLVIAVCATLVFGIAFGVLGLILGWGLLMCCVGLITGFITAVIALPKPIARMKTGKPRGYLMKLLKIKAAQWGIIAPPYLKRTGHWTTKKRVRKDHV